MADSNDPPARTALPTKSSILRSSTASSSSQASSSSPGVSPASTLSHKFGRLLGTVLSNPSSSSSGNEGERALRRGWVDLVPDVSSRGPPSASAATGSGTSGPTGDDSMMRRHSSSTGRAASDPGGAGGAPGQASDNNSPSTPTSPPLRASTGSNARMMEISEPSPLRPTWLRSRSRTIATPPAPAPSVSSTLASVVASPSKWIWGTGSMGRKAKEAERTPLSVPSRTAGADVDPDDAQMELDDEGFFDGAGTHVKRFDVLAALPLELALYVFLFLPSPGLLSAAQVSKAWNALASDNSIWRDLFHSEPAWKLRPTYDPPPAERSAPLLSPPSTPTNHSRRNMSSLATPTSPSLPSFDQRPDSHNWKHLVSRRQWLSERWGNPTKARETVFKGHDDSVYCLQFDALRLVTGSRDKNIKVWSLETGECLQTVRAHEASVLCLMYDEVSGLMVTGGSDAQVVLWDLGGPALADTHLVKRQALRQHSQGVLDVALSDDYVVSCSKDMTLHVTSRSTFAHLHTLQGHAGPVNALGLSGHRVASASGDGKIRLWDLRSGECTATLEGHARGLACVELKDDWVVSGSNDRTIKVWSVATGQCLHTLRGHTELVRTLAFDPASQRIVSGGYDKKILIWDLLTGEIVAKLRSSHTSLVFDIKFDAGRIASASHDQRVVLHDFGDAETGRMFI